MEDLVRRLYTSDVTERLRLLRDPAAAEALGGYFAPQALAELGRLSSRADLAAHLADSPPNVLFVPGIMGSLLNSATLGGLWWLDLRHLGLLERLRLDATGEGDAEPRVAIQPIANDFTYEAFLSAFWEQPDLVAAPFAFDWRKPLAASAARLADAVERLSEESGGGPQRPVHLVGHSMGGLLIRTALRLHGERLWPRVGKVVFVGTPHHGAAVIAGYLENHLWGFEALAVLGSFLSRGTFRSLRGVLELLPAPVGVYPGTRPGDEHPTADFDLYDAGAWRLEMGDEERRLLQDGLDAARAAHEELAAGHRALDQAQRDRMLMIAGVGYKTVFRVEKGWFGRARTVTGRQQCVPGREGDGRVPLTSALLPDIETRYAKGVHGGLTNVPAVYEEVFRFLRGEPLRLPDRCAAVFEGHLAPEEAVSLTPHLDGSALAAAAPEADDPGFLAPEPPDDDWRREQVRRYEAGELALPQLQAMALDRVKIL
jgi:pimeloyl-ACP methyl ester carboxylesterase